MVASLHCIIPNPKDYDRATKCADRLQASPDLLSSLWDEKTQDIASYDKTMATTCILSMQHFNQITPSLTQLQEEAHPILSKRQPYIRSLRVWVGYRPAPWQEEVFVCHTHISCHSRGRFSHGFKITTWWLLCSWIILGWIRIHIMVKYCDRKATKQTNITDSELECWKTFHDTSHHANPAFSSSKLQRWKLYWATVNLYNML